MEKPLRFVIVEDERIVARDLANQVTNFGYQVPGIAGTPAAALQMAEQARPDIMLMDIRLSTERDGISVAQEIRERMDIPSIFVTAYTDEETLRRAEQARPIGYIVKPFRLPELKAVLLMAAAQFRLVRTNEENRAWLAAVLGSMGDAVIALDPQKRITLVNRATEELLKERGDLLLGRAVGDVLDMSGPDGTVTVRTEAGARTVEISTAEVRAERDTATGTVLVLRDVTDRMLAANLIQRERDFLAGRVTRAGAELERTRDELQALARSLITAQEDEQRRIAREIHDDLAQRAAALEFQAASIEQALEPGAEDARKQVKQLRAAICDLSDSMRELSHHLHPAILDDLGLEIALRRYTEDFAHRENISIIFRAARVPHPLPLPQASAVYRIAQEALRNLAKHSGSPVAVVALARVGEELRLTVRDRGEGFDPARVRYGNGLGLISMQERAQALAGRVAVFSKAGSGTLLTVRVPLGSSE